MPAAPQARLSGEIMSALSSCNRRSSVASRARLRVCFNVSSLSLRSSSRALVPASCTCDKPCSLASLRNRPTALKEMPMMTSNTSTTLMVGSSVRRLVFSEVSSSPSSHFCRVFSMGYSLTAITTPFNQCLDQQRDNGQQHQQRRDRERADEIVFAVQNFDMQWHGVGQTANVPGHH